MITTLNKYKHAWVALYGLIYLPWFIYLETNVTENYSLIHSRLDDYIPFCEIFIIPYLLWFLYVAVVTLYLFFTSTKEFYKMTAFLCIGMTLFLIISTLYPNGQNLRPLVFDQNNIFIDLVRNLYLTDTPTNIFPSIHVYNSLGAYIGILHAPRLQQNKFINYSCLILTILIIISTVTLKQHSIIDVFGAFIIAIPTYLFIYKRK